MNFIKSPLNYTGNKYRILSQMLPHFPTEINVMVDLFCGGATVGLNTPCNKVVFVDNNPMVIGLLQFLSRCDIHDLVKQLEDLISQYQLSYSAKMGYAYYRKFINDNPNNGLKQYNSNGFYRLRDDYNSLGDKDSHKSNLLLYLLLIYGFNNDLRFSKDGKYNLPVGKTDFNRNNINKLKDFIMRSQSISCDFICDDFKSNKILDVINQADFVYMDPPYLITDAVYNESGRWNEQSEYELLNLMEYFLENEVSFVLSNVLEKRGKRNEPLFYWTTKHNTEIDIIDIDYHYRGASYNKKDRLAGEREIILIPKERIK